MDIITKGDGWKLLIDNKYSSFYDIKVSPGSYKLKLTHECYEDINFNANVRKATDEVFDLSGKAVLKCGVLEVKSADAEWTLDIGDKNYHSLDEVALLPGLYKAKLTHKLYEDIDFDAEVKKGERMVFDILGKKVPRFGYLDIKSSDYRWNVSIYSKYSGNYSIRSYNLQSSNNDMLLPGTYNVGLTHENPECFEDIDFETEIKRGEVTSFDISDKIKPKTASLALYVKYKGRNQKEPVFIDGKEVGKTPFKELVPVCDTKSAEFGKDKINVNLNNLKSGVEYTHNLSTLKNTLLSLALGIAGGVLLYNAYSYNAEANDYVDKYNELNSSYPLEYDRLRKKANDAHGMVPIFLISGGALTVSAVGVYIWF